MSFKGRDNDFFLKDGYANYTRNNDTIRVGPGKSELYNVGRMESEDYSTHFGSIKSKGKHLYITGLVPFQHEITIG